ncbi:MAG TPA: DNA replication and repair protein RecF [Gemmatimonadales bacterium]|nr:DNA replication and repair protein RecF [Gemmatimonadales bacterium]
MELGALTIRSFRNITRLDLEIPPEGVVIIGGNGHGKTNLLEAIYYLVLFRSLRGAKDRELVKFGEAGFFVAGSAAERRVTAGYDSATRRKKVTLDGMEVTKLGDAVGRILAVPFSPADAAIVASGPAARRRYLDVLLSVSERGYLNRLSALRHGLKQRNAALRRGNVDEARAFDRPFAEAAVAVTAARRRWVEQWAGRFAELCAALGEREAASMRYQSHEPASVGLEGWVELLDQSVERDVRCAATTVGPHRDDLRITLRGRDIRTYGSAGQQRTGAIALRLLEAETLRAAHNTAPLALYDDVFAELDQDRQERLLRLIREVLPGQSIVVAPRDAEVPAALFDRPRWQIAGGVIER